MEGGMVFFKKWCRFLKLEFIKSEDEGKSRLVLFHVWKNPSRNREGGTEGEIVVFQK